MNRGAGYATASHLAISVRDSKQRCGDLDKSSRVDFVNDVTGLTTRLAVEIIALYKDAVIT